MRLQPLLVQQARDASQISQEQKDYRDPQPNYRPAHGRIFYPILAATSPAQHALIVIAGPDASPFPQTASATHRGLTEDVLMRSVVTDYPVAPERGHGIDVKSDPAPALWRSRTAPRSGIECLPAVAGKIGFHPGVRVFGADHVVSRDVVELVGTESVDHSGWNAQGAKHHGHR